MSRRLGHAPRVVHLTTVPDSLIFFDGQLKYLVSRGFDVHVVSSPGDQLATFGVREGVSVHPVPMERRIRPVADLIALCRLVRLLGSLRPAIVHAHTPKAGLLGMVAAAAVRTPVRIYHIHGLRFETAGGLRRRLLRASEWLACRIATQVLCVSHSALQLAVDEGLCRPAHGKVLLDGSINGIDSVRFTPQHDAERARTKAELQLPDDSLVIGFVGRVSRDKGCVVLAEAFHRLGADDPRLRLLVVGPPERFDPLPPDTLAMLHANPRVVVTGPVDDPARYYAAMDVLALPTYREGFGLAAAEASAMGLPVVATRTAGCVDAVVDGVTGALVTPGDPGELAAALRRYLDDPALRRNHGSAGRARIQRSFQPAAMWAALVKEYRRLLGEAPTTAQDPITVMHVFGRMTRGGAETRTLELMRRMDRGRVRFVFCATSGSVGELDNEIRELGGEVYYCPLDRTFVGQFRAALQDSGVSVVHSHLHTFSGIILLIARGARVPVRIAHFRSDTDGQLDSARRKLQRLVMRALVDHNATNILAVAPGTMAAVWGEAWAEDPRSEVVLNGIDLEPYRTAPVTTGVRAEFGATSTDDVLMHIGRPSPTKNRPFALDLARELHRRGRPVVLVYVGAADDAESVALRARAAEMGLADHVWFLGERSDIPALMRAADLVVAPSSREGLPGIVLEACAAGTTVLATPLPGVLTIASYFPLVHPLELDLDLWADTACKLLHHRTTPGGRADAVRQFDGSPFSLDRSADRLVQIYGGHR